jgi:hypothetical protein
MTAVLLAAEHHWDCPNCVFTDVTYESQPHTRMHSCKGLRGLTAPMVPAGTKCKVEAIEREDYARREVVQKDGEGKVIMAVEVTRDEGTDLAVLAPCATLRGDED